VVKEHGQGGECTVWMASPGDEDGFILVLLGGGPAHAQDSADMTHYGSAVLDRADVNPIAKRGHKEGYVIESQPRPATRKERP
jgi:hypothetical protein